MRRKVLITQCIILMMAVLYACSEPITVHTRKMDRSYFIVEGLLTDREDLEQYVKLSVSVPYFSEEGIKPVHDAEVVVSDGETEFLFTEQAADGEYHAPEGFKAFLGKKYKLSVKAVVEGETHQYEAEDEMPVVGFELEKIDYLYNGNTPQKLDSLWTVLLWGKDDLSIKNNYLACISVNGYRLPLGSCFMMEDKYFSGKQVEAFPVGLLSQTAENLKNNGPCAKFLEEGDVLTLDGYALSPGYYQFLSCIHGDGGSTSNMPLMATQPVNAPTNLHGDGYVLGYFAVCSTLSTSVTVTDPYQVIEYHP